MLRRACSSLVSSLRAKSTIAAAEPRVIGSASEQVFEKEERYGAHNYKPIPVALQRGEGKATFSVFYVCTKYKF